MRVFRPAAASVLLAFAMLSSALAMSWQAAGQQGAKPKPAPAKPPAAPQFFATTLSIDEMRNKQAVVETDLGTIVIDLLPDAAPNHVGYFIKNAQDGTYAGTAFHRVVRQGIVQGGDPLSKDPSKVDAYGTGGFGVLRAERNAEKNTRGAVSAVVGAGNPDSGGTQFFICVADQPGLDGTYDVFGRVSEGILVAQKISEVAADEKGRPKERIAIKSVTIRDKPAASPEAFSTESVGRVERVSRGARNEHGQHHHRVRSGQGAGARAEFPAAGRGRCLQRDGRSIAWRRGLSSRRATCRREAKPFPSLSSGSFEIFSRSSTTLST